MKRNPRTGSEPIRVEVFLGAAPLLETRLVEGLLRFGDSHPRWRFALRGADARYTVDGFRRQRIGGALVLIAPCRVGRMLDAAGIPWVHLLPSKPGSRTAVAVDDRAIGRMGAGYFLERGFRRFAFCGVGTSWSRLRATGFREALAAHEADCRTFDIPFAYESNWVLGPEADHALRRWLDTLEPGTAAMVAHDVAANRLVDVCVQKGVRVPDDLAVLGVGDHELFCRLSPVPISSIDCAVPEVARQGAILLERLLSGRPAPARVHVAPVGVVERRSTETLMFDSDLVNRLVAHIRDHAAERLKVQDLVRLFPVSRRTLNRRFHAHLGHAAGEEIRRARIRLAEHMLGGTTLSLVEIAARCGYADAAHLTRAFRRTRGVSPGAVRRKPEKR